MTKEFEISDDINKPELLKNAKELQEEYERTASRVDELESRLENAEKEQEALEEAQNTINKLRQQLEEGSDPRVEELKAQVQELKGRLIAEGKSPVPIEGTFTVGSGKNRKTYKFADGHLYVRDRNGLTIPTEELLKIANNGKYEPEQDLREQWAGLAQLDQDKAKALLERLAEINYGYLVEV